MEGALFLVLSFVTAHYEIFGRVLRCTFTVQEQLQVGVGYWAMLCDLVMSVATVLYKRMSMGLGYTFVACLSIVLLFPYVRTHLFGC